MSFGSVYIKNFAEFLIPTLVSAVCVCVCPAPVPIFNLQRFPSPLQPPSHSHAQAIAVATRHCRCNHLFSDRQSSLRSRPSLLRLLLSDSQFCYCSFPLSFSVNHHRLPLPSCCHHRRVSPENMKKYGLQLRVPPSQQKKQPTKPPLPPPLGFRDDDDDDVEREISRHASKNKALREIDEQHKKALEEDPSVFDYDGVYDEMKEKTVRNKLLIREDKQPKYIQKLIQKAEERQREHDVIYERKLAKERNKEEHLYADKDKFVTSAYKKKLEERQQWEAQQRLRDLRDEKEDVTKKKDLSDFYFNLGKNIAFGGNESKKLNKLAEQSEPEKLEERGVVDAPTKDHSSTDTDSSSEIHRVKEGHQTEASLPTRSFESSDSKESLDPKPASDMSGSDSVVDNKSAVGQPSTNQPKRDHHKRNEDAIAAAKERFLARKRAKEQ